MTIEEFSEYLANVCSMKLPCKLTNCKELSCPFKIHCYDIMPEDWLKVLKSNQSYREKISSLFNVTLTKPNKTITGTQLQNLINKEASSVITPDKFPAEIITSAKFRSLTIDDNGNIKAVYHVDYKPREITVDFGTIEKLIKCKS